MKVTFYVVLTDPDVANRYFFRGRVTATVKGEVSEEVLKQKAIDLARKQAGISDEQEVQASALRR